MKIPEGYLEIADKYIALPNNSFTPIKIGGQIMFNLVVREQMELDKIMATSGLGNKVCMIIVDYTLEEILKFISNANSELNRMRKGGIVQ